MHLKIQVPRREKVVSTRVVRHLADSLGVLSRLREGKAEQKTAVQGNRDRSPEVDPDLGGLCH